MSRLFWCIYERPGFDDFPVDKYLAQLESVTARILIANDRMVGFSDIGKGAPSTVFQESTQRYSSIGEGLAHVLAAIGHDERIYDGKRTRELPLPGAMQYEFDGKTTVHARLRLVDIRPDGSQWRLQVEGLKGKQATIVLDKNYQVVRASVVFGR